MMIFAPLDGSASLVTSLSSRSAFPVIPSSSMTLRNRDKGKKSSVPISNIVGRDDNHQKDETITSSGLAEDGGAISSSLSSTEEDETSTVRKKLPRVILRLGKPPDLLSV
jgi:hypothetical protein